MPRPATRLSLTLLLTCLCLICAPQTNAQETVQNERHLIGYTSEFWGRSWATRKVLPVYPTEAVARNIQGVVETAVGIVSSTAQSTQEDAKDERKFENTIPEHVPLKVKLRNEQSFKNPKNRKWMRELEIEVKNTGSKPIYYLYVIVKMPEVIVQGHPLGFRVVYGRRELVRITTPLQPNDVPILPGETVTLKVPESRVKAYEGLMNEATHDDAKKVRFDLQFINFGDGTGLVTTQGLPFSIPPKQSLNEVRPQRQPDHSPPANLSS